MYASRSTDVAGVMKAYLLSATTCWTRSGLHWITFRKKWAPGDRPTDEGAKIGAERWPWADLDHRSGYVLVFLVALHFGGRRWPEFERSTKFESWKVTCGNAWTNESSYHGKVQIFTLGYKTKVERGNSNGEVGYGPTDHTLFSDASPLPNCKTGDFYG